MDVFLGIQCVQHVILLRNMVSLNVYSHLLYQVGCLLKYYVLSTEFGIEVSQCNDNIMLEGFITYCSQFLIIFSAASYILTTMSSMVLYWCKYWYNYQSVLSSPLALSTMINTIPSLHCIAGKVKGEQIDYGFSFLYYLVPMNTRL